MKKSRFRRSLHTLLTLLLWISSTPQGSLAADPLPVPKSESEIMKVALLAPLTGSTASWGVAAHRAALMALEDLPEVERKQFELMVENDEFDPKKTLAAFQRLSSQHELNAVIVMGSPPANALAPIVEKKEQVLVAVGASDPSIVSHRTYSFIHWSIPPLLAQRLVSEIKLRSFRRVALVTSEVSGTVADGAALATELSHSAPEATLVYNNSFAAETTDFRSCITAIRSKKADLVVLVLLPGSLAPFAMQARQLGLTADIVGMETFEDKAEVDASKGALIGLWYVNGAEPKQEFADRFLSRWKEPPSLASANMYDTIRLLAKANKLGTRRGGQLVSFLRSVRDYAGMAGTYSSSGDNRFTLPVDLRRVTKDGFVTIQSSAQGDS